MDLINIQAFSLIFLLQVCSVVSESCTFYTSATTLVRTCTTGCCDSGCCADDYKSLAIILGTVFGCLLLIFIIAIVVVCLTRDRWSKRVNPIPKDSVQKKRNDDVMLTDMETNNTASV
ncbi:uncharacterized protein LOC110453360 [Mizuhopecten yessoensis]|uniref:uncharacterized protein LOC110453360 n=1 Tax=Mizuhopecten yessoensis TaxID=6573 RepID=UPI000B45A778|nr:uncharacterized protein LOC110453360 [Mizuhopecten yessoensis]